MNRSFEVASANIQALKDLMWQPVVSMKASSSQIHLHNGADRIVPCLCQLNPSSSILAISP